MAPGGGEILMSENSLETGCVGRAGWERDVQTLPGLGVFLF